MFLRNLHKIVCIAKRLVKSQFVYQNEGYPPIEPSYEELVEERAKRNLDESASAAELLLINGDTPENVKNFVTEEITNIAAYERGEANGYPKTIRAINTAEAQAKLTLSESLRRFQSFKKIQLDIIAFNAVNTGRVDSVPSNITGFNTLLRMRAKLSDMQTRLANLAYPEHATIILRIDIENTLNPVDVKLRTIMPKVYKGILEGAEKAYETAKNIIIETSQETDVAGLMGHKQLLTQILPFVEAMIPGDASVRIRETINRLDFIIESEPPKEPKAQV